MTLPSAFDNSLLLPFCRAAGPERKSLFGSVVYWHPPLLTLGSPKINVKTVS